MSKVDTFKLSLDTINECDKEVIDTLQDHFTMFYGESKEGMTRASGKYDIETGVSNFINYVKLGKTPREKLQIFMMCYMYNPTRKELVEWDLDKFMQYIKETNEYFEEDKKYFDEICKLIKS